jgi:hypothetical protein
MRKLAIILLLLPQILLAQESGKIESLIDEILKKIENYYSAEETLSDYQIQKQKELQKQLERIRKQLEILKKQKDLIEPEKFQEELEKIQKTAIEIQRASQELIEQGQNKTTTLPFVPSFRFRGETEIGRNDYIDGNVLVQDGDLKIYGRINGDILVENGDVFVEDGAEVNGNIYTTNGKITIRRGAKFTGEKYENFSQIAKVDSLISYDRRKHRLEIRYKGIYASFGGFKQFHEDVPGVDNFYFEFERVSGFKIGLIYPRKFINTVYKPISMYGYGAYATKSHRWIFLLGLNRLLFNSNDDLFLILGAEIYSTIGTKDNWLISPNANTISALLWNNDYRDYFKQEGFNIYLETAILSKVSDLMLRYSSDNYASEVSRYIKYFSWNEKRQFRANPPVYEGNLKSISINYRVGGFHLIEGFRKSGVGFEIYIERELGNLKYTILTSELKARLSLSNYDNFGFRLKVGASDQILPKQKSFEIGGFGTLYAFPYKAFEGNKMLLANFEYILKNPIDVFDFVNFFIFFDAGYVNSEEGKLTSGFKIKNLSEIKSDFGFGFGTESMKTRIYFAWRTDRKTPPIVVLRLSNPF